MTRHTFTLLVLSYLVFVPGTYGQESPRRPVAMAFTEQGTKLLVANRDTGTISVLDTRSHQVLFEVPVGGRLSDLAVMKDGETVFATDEKGGELAVLRKKDASWKLVHRIKVAQKPASVQIMENGRRVSVASVWGRRVQTFQWTPGPDARLIADAEFDLPFSPRLQIPFPNSARILVADAFGGKLAVLDVAQKRMDSIRSLANHNIRGLSLDRTGKNVLLTHQLLHAQGHANAGDIRSGSLLANTLRKIPLEVLSNPQIDLLGNDQIFSLGDVEQGAGDPADLVETADGRIVVAVAGTREILVGRPEEVLWTRIPVEARPTALAYDEKAKRVYVANTFSDSISVLDLQSSAIVATIALGKTPALTAEQRGEMLFHDARLSFESWFSCHSCHIDGHTNGRLNDNLSDGSFGTPKRVLSLLGVKDTAPWAWNGKVDSLETQVRNSVQSTMQGKPLAKEQVSDLASYLRSLSAPPAVAASRQESKSESFDRGQRIFAVQKCATCHTPPTLTSGKTYDVGIHDELGGTRFNPPSLRGVSQAGPYFHDNRAATLEDVFGRHRHQLREPLPPASVRDLVEFLRNQ